MKQYKTTLKEAEASLSVSGQETRIASIVMEELFGMSFTKLMVYGEDLMPKEDYRKFKDVIERVCQNEPYQYVLGEAYFYDGYFTVTPDTLIPRNETEELVAFVLDNEKDTGLAIVDIGTGTGAIGLTLARHWKKNRIIVTDLSGAALNVARKNGERLGVTAEYLEGSLFAPLVDKEIKADIIISNPPYISEDEKHLMTASVLEHEPDTALFADDKGLALYKEMIRTLPDALKPGGRVYFEIGFNQAEALKTYIENVLPGTDVQVVKDMNQNDRILYFTRGE
ncbi:release factor glutamine methyltransferase [Jeotgalicoccus coquinae]|uniref:Release factor glutamine methyltransferase n=1 Tax=Jeotgalicoccus coquinae TaxID=709509 RepID=A0A6V7RQ71_9STAP|nr:peptide chain release factor N(5)-glutamine methyltransferase [Jeotgalicoccus coquinae]MBB6424032.1 release factor glutamine methyltransferase [Jeotgalicoccus coquinae]GGE23027.1 release factor glutamine methyltransferase [Jeotgalicoccus coquinae]CAD2080030.1 Release factor glutamine methyltransferase [Jeotgalicoccus coquinae]